MEDTPRRAATTNADATGARAGAIAAFIPMAAGSGVGLPLGAILGVATYLARYRYDRRALVALLGPVLAASRGELPPPQRDHEPEPDREHLPPHSPNV